MIPKAEILELRNEWQLRADVVEKDYALSWLLAGIAAQPELNETWIFKGGTALRKCYYETYRLSEDLDFTIVRGGPEEPAALTPIFNRIGEWLYEACGLELILDEGSCGAGTVVECQRRKVGSHSADLWSLLGCRRSSST